MPTIYYTGSRGGKYSINEKGQKVYEKKKPKKTSPTKPIWGGKDAKAALERLKQPNEKFLVNTGRRPTRSTRALKKDYSPRSSRSSRSNSSASSSIPSPPSGRTHQKQLKKLRRAMKIAKQMPTPRRRKPAPKINYLSSYDEAWFQEQALRKKYRGIAKIAAKREGRPVRRIKTRDGVYRPLIRYGRVEPPSPEFLLSRATFLPFGWIIDENGRTIPIPELLSKTPSNSTEAREERKRRSILSSAIKEGRLRLISPVGLPPHAQNKGEYRRPRGTWLRDFFDQEGLVGHLGTTRSKIFEMAQERPNMSKVLLGQLPENRGRKLGRWQRNWYDANHLPVGESFSSSS